MTKVPATPENDKRCICPKCPTFLDIDCPRETSEVLYCGRGTSKCHLAEKGCLCGDCPVWAEYQLKQGYFCART